MEPPRLPLSKCLIAWVALATGVFGDEFDGYRSAVAPAGDVNGDEVPDVLVAPRGRPSVWVLSGSSGAALVGMGGGELEDFGRSLASVGDVDSDGVPDAIVGAQDCAVVFSGATGEVLHRLEAQREFEDFGASVAGGGDLDGDGIPDWIVGAPSPRLGQSGRSYLYSGLTGSLIRVFEGSLGGTVSWSPAEGRAADSSGHGEYEVDLGFTVAILEDLDGRGRAELAMTCGSPMRRAGYPFDTAGPPKRSSSVEVLRGEDYSTLFRFEPTEDDKGEFGWAVGSAGDTDCDGVPDIYLSSVHSMARIYSGKSGAALCASSYNGGYEEAEGSTMDGLGDVDGDGHADYVVGGNESCLDFDPGLAEVRSGATCKILWTWTPPQFLERPGMPENDGVDVCAVGDVNADSVPDFALALRRTRRLRMISGKTFEVIYDVDLETRQL